MSQFEWMPMETAPLDCTQILIKDDTGTIYAAAYNPGVHDGYPWEIFDPSKGEQSSNAMREDGPVAWAEWPAGINKK